jgi:predicted NAD/FAD-dependent oxidoreductase
LTTTEILIVGAGMAGLMAAAKLQRAGREVLVVESGRSVGGRIASRRIGQATFDHGAQFITARSQRFVAAVDDWLHAGVAREWFRSSSNGALGHPRWRGEPSMVAIPQYVAQDLKVRLQTALVSLQLDAHCWVAALSSGETVSASAVLLTPPVPVSLALLGVSRTTVAAHIRARLEQMAYQRCLAVMAVLDGPSGIPAPGGLAPRDGPVGWIADNQAKGISPIPAITLHATGAFSLVHWEDDRRETGNILLNAAEPWLRSNVIEYQVHAWPYSRAVSLEQSSYLALHPCPPLLIAGDAFAAPRVEGAALSGWAAADALKGIDAHG